MRRPGRTWAHVATASFMVDPEHHGQGVGRALGRYVIDWTRDAGFEILATVPEAFDHPEHGPVGLHVMFQRL